VAVGRHHRRSESAAKAMAWPPANALLLAEISTGAATEPLAKMTEGQAARCHRAHSCALSTS